MGLILSTIHLIYHILLFNSLNGINFARIMNLRLKYFLLLIAAAFLFIASPSLAQCPMCKASVEASLKEGSTYALGLNRGILYLLAMPYLTMSAIFLLWYRHQRKNKVVV